MLDWGDLRHFLAVADRGSVSAAARGLGQDKATISRRIASLEKALGVRLFERKASGWTLTVAGGKAIDAVRRVEQAISVMQTDIAGESSAARATVRLSAPQWFCSEVLLPRVSRFASDNHWIDLNLSARSKVADLSEREAEIGLRNIRPPRGEFVIRKAGELGSALYASKEFLERTPPIVNREDLSGRRLVGYPDRVTYVPGFAWLDRIQGVQPPPLRVDDALTITAALRSGAGIGVLPCFLGDRDFSLRRVIDEQHLETIWIVAPTDVARTVAVRRVIAFLADSFTANAAALRGNPAGNSS